MSLITRCPACGTMFRVVPDQLKVSDGWVRCGHCSEVFDAQANMQQDPAQPEPAQAPGTSGEPPPEAAPSDSGPQPATEPEPGPAPEAAAEPIAESTTETAPDEVRDGPPSQAPADDWVLGTDMAVPTPEPDPQPSDAWVEPPAGPEAEDVPDRLLQEPARTDDAVPRQRLRAAPLAEHDQELQDVSFLRAARRRAFWQQPAVRAVLLASAVLLALAALLQWLVLERDRLSAAEPALRPVLAELCRPLGCRVDAPRQIESLAIENSAFNKLRPDVYRLSFTLRNSASLPVALPALELTLTDSQDQPLLRRVLGPQELGATGTVLGAAGDWTPSIAVAVSPGSYSGRIAGYRLLAFYP